MKFFADRVIKPYILSSGYRRVCEIGACRGENTDKILELDQVDITLIDPCIDMDLAEKYRGVSRLRVLRGTSLEVLPGVQGEFDCILMDGDHNWYTVFHELETIRDRGLLRRGGTIFFHDVGWPYGLRDMYYQPELIPAEFIHPHKQIGLTPGKPELDEASTFNAHLHNAVHEGGPKNGVLRAILDFVQAHPGEYRFFQFGEQHGLGVLIRSGGIWPGATFLKYRLKAGAAATWRAAKRLIKRLLGRP